MCIRDRYTPAQRQAMADCWFAAMFQRFKGHMRLNYQSSLSACLLYTSDRCRRIERSPSRGLGDVYKRQIYACTAPSHGRLLVCCDVSAIQRTYAPQLSIESFG